MCIVDLAAYHCISQRIGGGGEKVNYPCSPFAMQNEKTMYLGISQDVYRWSSLLKLDNYLGKGDGA